MLTILIGKSGCGKTAVMNKLTSKRKFLRFITTTTRPVRKGEKDGITYDFTDKKTFFEGVKNDKFIEYRAYNTYCDGKPVTWYYGSPKKDLKKTRNYVIILDIEGAEKFVKHYGKENCAVIYIDVPDDIRKERAVKRGDFNETEWNNRLENDNLMFRQSEIMRVANFIISNTGDIEDTEKGVVNWIKTIKSRRSKA